MVEPAKTCPQCNAPMPEGSTSSLCAKCLLQVGFETDPGPTVDSESRAYQPTFIAPTIDELAPHFPQLEILEQIGHGGMGVVYKARQTELDRIVALKILRPNISNDVSFAERFQREARALAKLNHPNIVTIYDFGRKDGLFFFIMEYVDGTNLRHVERSGQLSPQEALCIVPQVCSALQYAHDNGVVHRDIKPENILITKSGDVRIADFGLAKLAGIKDEAPRTGTWQVMGTQHYMAPEQFEKPTTVDHRADIYSLGVVIYELLTGELPIGRFRLPSEKVRVDVRLDEVVLRSLDKEPDRRYQRITDMGTAVSNASTERPATPLSDGQSRLDDTKKWITQATAVTQARVGEVLDKVRIPAKDRERSGTFLMWISVINLCVAIWSMTQRPYRDEVMYFGFMEATAACIAFWFAREYRRGAVTTPLWWLAVCSLPWVTAGYLFSLARVALTVVLLRSSSDQTPGRPTETEGDLPAEDVVDRASKWVCRVWQTLTLRNVLFTVFGIGGWLAICLATSVVVEVGWAQKIFPSTTFINDVTATNVIPVSDEYQRLDISASRLMNTQGVEIGGISMSYDSLRMIILGPESHQSILTVDLSTFYYIIDSLSSQIDQNRVFQREVIADWMTKADVDVSKPAVQLEIDNLFELVRLMQETRGNASSLSKQLARELPTLEPTVSNLMRARTNLLGDLVPVALLLRSDLFKKPTGRVAPNIIIHRKLWESIIYGIVTALIGLSGLLRVCRILYKHLFSASVTATEPVNIEVAQESSGKQWRNCCRALIAWAAISGSFVFLGYLMSMYTWGESEAILHQSRILIPVNFREIVLGFYVTMVLLISIAAMVARPILRRFGWWLGLTIAGVAVLTFPLNLVTFPSGLAAWILLTDPSVRQLFRADTKNNSGDHIS